MAQFPLLPLLPLLAPLYLPFVSPFTYLAPSRCDRNRPPPSQVACKLTPFAPLHPVDPPPPTSQTPLAPRLTTTTSGIFWLLVSRTITNAYPGRFFSHMGFWHSAKPSILSHIQGDNREVNQFLNVCKLILVYVFILKNLPYFSPYNTVVFYAYMSI
jgi:hypothetical protein